jgi:hypothetical protein
LENLLKKYLRDYLYLFGKAGLIIALDQVKKFWCAPIYIKRILVTQEMAGALLAL